MIASSIVLSRARALMAAMQPITGRRATGTVTMKAQPGTSVEIPVNTYFTPVLDGQRHTSFLFKVMDLSGSTPTSFLVTDTGTQVTLVSNVGGARHNVDIGTVFLPEGPIPNLIIEGADAPAATADFENGTDPDEWCGVRDMAFYESFDGPALSLDLHRSAISTLPAVLVAFDSLEPASGVTVATNDQGSVNAGTGKKFYKLNFTISVITERGEGDGSRRLEGLTIADTILQLLNDKHGADPCEDLSNPGGIQIRQMMRESGDQKVYQKFYIYTVFVSVMAPLERLDFRTFLPWLTASMTIVKPQSPSLPDQGDIEIVSDNVIDMTPNALDLAVDGTFARASAAMLWTPPGTVDGGTLVEYVAGARRVTNPSLGVTMEPAIANSLGASAEDLTAWTPVGTVLATVTADVEDDPTGTPGADRIDFGASDDSGIELAAGAVVASEPTTVQLFAKAPGTKFYSRIRIAVTDGGGTQFVSEVLEVGPQWDRYRFEIMPLATGAATVSVINADDASARQAVVWGVQFNDAARWGGEYVGAGATVQDALTFGVVDSPGTAANLLTPQSALTGRWALRFRPPGDVPPDMLGTGLGATSRILASIGNGVTELVTLTLIGTPATGGAALTLTTRAGGPQIALAGLEWVSGAELRFEIDATGGLTVSGTLNGDGVYAFDRYAEDAVAADRLVIGDVSAGGSTPTPGRYVAVEYNL